MTLLNSIYQSLVPNLGAVWNFCEACMATKPWLHNSDWKNLIPNTVNGEKIRASCCKPLFVIHINQTVQ